MTDLIQRLYEESRDNPNDLMWQAAFELERKDEVISRLQSTLHKIVDDMGSVCEEFEVCDHPSCRDSAGAVLLALDALK